MRKIRKKPKQIVAALAVTGVLCGSFLMVGQAMPSVSDVMMSAAKLSTLFNMSEMKDMLLKERFGSIITTDEVGGDDYAPTKEPPEQANPFEGNSSSQAPSSEESSPVGESSNPAERPANGGNIVEERFPKGGGSASYIPVGNGFIRNSTQVSAADVAAAAASPPAFHLEAGDAPQVLIMHTHATESYEMEDLGYYIKGSSARTTDNAKNMVAVGDEIAAQLKAAGIGVLHDTTQHDYPSYNGAYDRSEVTVKKYLEQYPSIKVVLDVHRDAIERDTGRVKPTAVIDGKKCAQVMVISGCDNGTMNMPNYMENLKFAASLQDHMETAYPGLTRPVLFDYRKYNQHLTTGSLLLEMGGHANTLEEAKYAGQLVGKSLVDTLKATIQ